MRPIGPRCAYGEAAPIAAVRMSWVAPGGVTATAGLGTHNFGGSLPKGGLESRRQVVLV
jgi:hypothetical protein